MGFGIRGWELGVRVQVFKQLTRQVDELSSELTTKIRSLSIDQLEALDEALLDFTQPNDLTT